MADPPNKLTYKQHTSNNYVLPEVAQELLSKSVGAIINYIVQQDGMKYYMCKRLHYLFTEQLKWKFHTHEDNKREVQINFEAICSVDLSSSTNLPNQYDVWQQTRVTKPEKQR